MQMRPILQEWSGHDADRKMQDELQETLPAIHLRTKKLCKIDKYRKLELYKMVEILKELRIIRILRKRKLLQNAVWDSKWRN